jgi:hypothetical protein
MRKSIFKGIGISLFPLIFLGCATATTTMRVEKRFQFSGIDRIHQGMKEEEVIRLLGKPTAIGIDEQGREYLLYQQTGYKQTMGMSPPIGYTHVSASSIPTGFEVRIYVKDKIVQSVGYTLYRE